MLQFLNCVFVFLEGKAADLQKEGFGKFNL